MLKCGFRPIPQVNQLIVTVVGSEAGQIHRSVGINVDIVVDVVVAGDHAQSRVNIEPIASLVVGQGVLMGGGAPRETWPRDGRR